MPRFRPPELSEQERAESARYAFEQKQLVLKRYRKMGLEWGFLVGALLGVLGGGLQMSGWESPLLGWAIVTAFFSAVGGLLGYFCYDLIFGSQIRDALSASNLGGDFGGGVGGGDGGGDGD